MLKFFLQALYQSAQHLYEKRERSGSVPLDPGGPKTCGSGSPRLPAATKHEVWPDVLVVRGADANVLLVDLLAYHLGPELRVQHHSQAPCRSHHQPAQKTMTLIISKKKKSFNSPLFLCRSGSRVGNSPQKRTSNTSKHEISKFYSIFVGHLCHPGSGSRFRIRIRLQIHWPNWIRIQSGSETLLQDTRKGTSNKNERVHSYHWIEAGTRWVSQPPTPVPFDKPRRKNLNTPFPHFPISRQCIRQIVQRFKGLVAWRHSFLLIMIL